MKKIKDERLKLKNLKNIRLAYIVQTLGIIAILAYDLIRKGTDAMKGNPLWFVLIISTTALVYSAMDISVDHEKDSKSPKKSFIISFLILLIISAIVGIFSSNTSGSNRVKGLIMGGIPIICGLVPIIYIYYLRKKRLEDLED